MALSLAATLLVLIETLNSLLLPLPLLLLLLLLLLPLPPLDDFYE